MAVKEQKIGERYAIYLGDGMEVMPALPKESVHLSLYSPPFGGLYQHSSSERDLSNSDDYRQFFEHYAFFVREMYRLTMPGRMTAVHCMDIVTGSSGLDHFIDFPGDIIRCHEHEGWHYAARYAIWKEPLAVRNRTYAKHLMHTSIVQDSSRCSPALADYLLVFRRRGVNPVPIAHPTGLMEYVGERDIPPDLLRFRGYKGDQIYNRYSHWIWRQYASAFWDDIRVWRTLPFLEDDKDEDEEKHPHPLQLDVIERALVLWSNPGETVLSPYMGVGSEVCGALANGRKAIGIELKDSYYKQSQRNIQHTLKHGLSEGQTRELLSAVAEEPRQMTIEEVYGTIQIGGEPVMLPADSVMGAEMIDPEQRNMKAQ